MHFEILVEDQSGKKALDILVPKIIGEENSFRVISYKGIGRIPGNLGTNANASKRILLDQLPRLLRGYGKTYASYPKETPAAVILVCDLDNKNLKTFREELDEVLNSFNPKPVTRFCIAIEEGEAWFLGDLPAIKAVYPNSNDAILNDYVNDSICGTWELLADALSPGGSQALKVKGWQAVGKEKLAWAENISPHMDMDNNASPSFCYFRKKILELAEST
jgi:hypothetical protein